MPDMSYLGYTTPSNIHTDRVALGGLPIGLEDNWNGVGGCLVSDNNDMFCVGNVYATQTKTSTFHFSWHSSKKFRDKIPYIVNQNKLLKI